MSQQSSTERGRLLVARLIERADDLGVAPNAGTPVRAIGGRNVRELLERPYRLVYLVDSDRVVVLTVKHYRQRLIERPSDF